MTVYKPIIDKIRAEIANGTLKPSQMLGTELGLSREFGISRSSMRSGIDLLVKEKLIQRKPGRGLFVTTTPSVRLQSLAIVVPNLGEMWATIVDGAQNEARKRGYKLQIYNVNSDIDTDLQVINELPKMAIKGALIVSVYDPKTSRAVINLHQQGFPVVMLDQRLQDIEISSIIFDNYAAGYMAGSKLVKLGHRRIGFVGFSRRDRACLRLEGLRDAVNDAGIPFDRSLVRETPFENLLHPELWKFEQKINDLICSKNRPTAIFFHTDNFAAEAYRLIRSSGLRIPQDISIVGCGNTKIGSLIDPRLATIELHCEKMGKDAIAMLLRLISGTAIENQILKTQWINGQSIATCNPSTTGAKRDIQA